MADWEFVILPPAQVEQELTQRDQFNNDDVGLSEALVREVIQNSTDAQKEENPVKVRFGLRELALPDADEFRRYFDSLIPHLQACEMGDGPPYGERIRILVIEDFNTKGLTGATGYLDDGNFRDFWRRHGKSSKGGRSGGRWGLGKLVFSSSSEIRSFFGLTIQEGDSKPLLMGQAVLANHEIDGSRFQPHGFWFEGWSDQKVQLPLSDSAQIERFRKLTGVTRENQTGLSIIIPYFLSGIEERSIIESVLTNYYFPILAGRLEVEVGSTLINKNTFDEVVRHSSMPDYFSKAKFNFIRSVSDRIEKQSDFSAIKPIGKQPLKEDFFKQDDLDAMTEAFSKGELVHAHIPVSLRSKQGAEITGGISLFIKSLSDEEKSFALFARGSITVPGEKKFFAGAHALGALVAAEETVTSFLGDAENPAHTAWNGNAEKLQKNWRNPSQTLRYIRYALRDLYHLIAEESEHRDTDALIDFFSLIRQSRSSGTSRQRSQRPEISPQPKPKGITIQPRQGGFVLVPGPAAQSWNFPKTIRIKVAYDVIGADPFTRHSKYDFDLQKNEIHINGENISEITPLDSKALELTVSSPDFRLEASGFDLNRDLVITAGTVT